MSPVTAVLLGWFVVDETFTPVQLVGIALVLLSVWQSQRANSVTAAREGGDPVRGPAVRAP